MQVTEQYVVVVPLRVGQKQPAPNRVAEENRPECGGQTVQGVDGQEVGQHVRHGQIAGQVRHVAQTKEEIQGKPRGRRCHAISWYCGRPHGAQRTQSEPGGQSEEKTH